MERQEIVMVTGASSGIGRATAQRLVNLGYKVIGTSRNPEQLSDDERVDGVTYVRLDHTDLKSIDVLGDILSTVNILINNAGSSQIGPTETIPFDRVEYLFYVNFFGPLKMIQTILPFMRKRGGGRIVNVTSLAGRWGLPFSSIYAATKFAMEGVTCGLRTEIKPWGIKIVNVAPSAVHTQIEQEVQFTETSPYFGVADTMKRRRDRFIDDAPDPDNIASVVIKAATAKHPRTWYSAGRHSRLLSLILRILPGRALEYMISSIYGIRH